MDHIDDEIPGAGTEGALPEDRRPIGYWLRQVDALITREFATVLADEGVTRRDWMLLNAVSGDVDVPGLAERLARKGKRLEGLERRGWVDQAGDGTWSLTDEGRAAKERIASLVGDIRERVAGAVAPEDYATTMASLEAIARVLGWTEDADARGGFGARFGRGYGPGFGPRFGRGFGRAFRPGWERGFGPGDEFAHGFGPGHGFEPGHGFGSGHGFGPGHGHAPGHGFDGGFGHDPHCGHGHGSWHEHYAHGGHYGDPDHAHGHRGHGHRHGHRRHDHSTRHEPGRGAEHAYERGFDAGYARGSAERD